MVGSLHNLKYTEEEEMFLKKLNKLKKKKKALVALKGQKPEKSETVAEQLSTDVCPAVKQAEKLKQLAALKEASSSKEKTYKRTKRRKDSDSKPLVAFHPFSPTETETHESNTMNPSKIAMHSKFNLYENFVLSSDADTQPPEPKKFKSTPKKGNTVYVSGLGINEKFLHNTFKKFGEIIHLTFEPDKNCAFVTFENMACAEEAIEQMNGNIVDEVLLKVSMARKQPNFDSSGEPADWSSIAASSSQKGSHKDRRNLVSYDEELF